MRSILVSADRLPGMEARLETALAIARTSQGHITLLVDTPVVRYVAMDPMGGSYVATDALKHGANVRQVQKLLGHALLATTERYLHTAESELDEAMLTVATRRAQGGARTGADLRRTRARRSPGDEAAPRELARIRSRRGGCSSRRRSLSRS